MARAEVRGSDLAGSAEAACEFVSVLEEEAEGLPHDSLEVVLAELEPLTEPLGHRHLVGRLTVAFAYLDPELPGRQRADADVCHRISRVSPWAGCVFPGDVVSLHWG